jgi:hypothetical protein
MRYVWTSVAVIAALAFAAPVWAQPASPSGGNPMGMPGPNPGGPGLTPYTTGAPPSAAEATSAMPPSHRHAHHARTAAHHGKAPQLTGSTANQLNQEELARLQAGNFSNPPVEMSPGAPSAPAGPMQANPNQMNRMSTGGRPTSGGPR